jgi:hypothetical protein
VEVYDRILIIFTVDNVYFSNKVDVIKFVKERAPEIIDSSDNVLLGAFDISSEIIWNQLRTKAFIQNIIKCTLIRDEYRKSN